MVHNDGSIALGASLLPHCDFSHRGDGLEPIQKRRGNLLARVVGCGHHARILSYLFDVFLKHAQILAAELRQPSLNTDAISAVVTPTEG